MNTLWTVVISVIAAVIVSNIRCGMHLKVVDKFSHDVVTDAMKKFSEIIDDMCTRH